MAIAATIAPKTTFDVIAIKAAPEVDEVESDAITASDGPFELDHAPYKEMSPIEIFPPDRTRGPKKKFKYMAEAQQYDKDFVKKWANCACEILIVKDIDKNRYGMSKYERVLNSFYLVPDDVQGVLVIGGGENGIALAREILAGNEHSFVLCDMTGTIEEAILPPDAFTDKHIEMFDMNSDVFSFEGDYDIIPDEVRVSFQYAQIVTAETGIIDALGVGVRTYGTYEDCDETEKRADVVSLVSMLSLGKLHVPTREEFGIPEETPIIDGSLPLTIGSPFTFTIRLDENQQKYVDELARVSAQVNNIIYLWELALNDTPFNMNVSRAMTSRYNKDLISDVAKSIGVDTMITALIDHKISCDDISVGMR